MRRDRKCRYCVNKSMCEECNDVLRDRFVPSAEVKCYFEQGHIGHGRSLWDFNTLNEALKPTHAIMIGNNYYCPYCGEVMYMIQENKTLAVVGHCCICEGARAELSYEEEKKVLEAEYEQKQRDLKEKYNKSLRFNTAELQKLFAIKQKKESDRFKYTSNNAYHFSEKNGEPYTKIEQFM